MFDTPIVSLKKYFEKVNYEKVRRQQQKIPSMQRVNSVYLKSENSGPIVFEIRRGLNVIYTSMVYREK